MYYRYIMPSKALAPYVNYYWILETDKNEGEITERVIPIDSMQLLFHYKNPFIEKSSCRNGVQPLSLISGLSNTFTDISTNGESGVIAVTFLPAGACNFFRFHLQDIENKDINLYNVDERGIKILEERIQYTNKSGEEI